MFNNDELRLLVQAELDALQVKTSVNKVIDSLNGKKNSFLPLLMSVTIDKKLLKQQVNSIIGEVNKELGKVTLNKLNFDSFASSTKSVRGEIKNLTNDLNQLQVLQNKIQSQRVKNFLSTKGQYLDSRTELGSRRLQDRLDVGENTIGRKEASLLKAMSTLHRERAKETERIYKANIKEVENYAKVAEKNLSRVGFATDENIKKLELLQKTVSKLKSTKFSDKEYEQLYREGSELGKSLSSSSKAQLGNFREKSLDQEKEKIKQLVQSYYELNKVSVGNLDASRLSGIVDKINSATDTNGLKLARTEFQMLKKEMDVLQAMSNSHKVKARESERVYNANIKEIENYARLAEKNLARVGFASDESRKKLEQLQRIVAKMKSSNYSDKGYKDLYQQGKNLGSSLVNNTEAQASRFRAKLLQQEKNNLEQLIKGYYSLNKGKLTVDTAGQLSHLLTKLDSATDSKGIRLLSNDFKILKRDIDLNTKSAVLFGDAFKGSVSKIVTGLGLYRAVHLATQGLRSMYEEVKKIDTAMTDLKKVTNETEGTYNSFLRKAGQDAKELRTSISNVVQSTAEWARLGYKLQEAQENAKASVILSHVGDVDIDTATKATISGLKAYGSELKDTMMLVDKYNEVGNNYAISSAGIAEAMRRSASSLKLAGNSLDEAIAIITAGNNVIQNPEMVGTMIKTMTMRLRGTQSIPETLKMELEEMGEDLSDFEEHVTQVQAKMAKFTQGRVNIMQDPNTFKSTYDILKDIRAVWDDLTDKDRASVVELIAGKRGGSIATAIIENMEEAERVKETSLTSFGSAMREQERWAESIEGHLGKLSASWQELASTTLNTDLLKSLIDFVRIITEMTNAVGGLMPVLTVLFGMMAGYKFEFLGVLLAKIPLLTNSLKALGVAGIEAGAGLSAGLSSTTIGIIVAGLWALSQAIDYFVVTADEQLEIVHEVAQAYKEYNEQSETYREQLDNNKSKIAELNELKLSGDITSSQQSELDLLIQQNEQLEIKLQLSEKLAELERQKLEKESVEYLNKKEYVETGKVDFSSGNAETTVKVNQIDKFDVVFERLLKLKKDTEQLESNLLKETDNRRIETLKRFINDSKNEMLEIETELATLIQTQNELAQNLSDKNPLKRQVQQNVNKYQDYLKTIEISSSFDETEQQIKKVEQVVNSLNDQMKTLSDRQKDLSGYIDEYNDKGMLTYETTMAMIERYPDMVKYLNETKDGYVLNTNALEGLNDVTRRQKELLKEYINTQREATGTSVNYLNESNAFLDGILRQHNSFEPTVTTGEFAQEEMQTEKLIEIINKVKELNTNFAEGKITHREYFSELQTAIDSIDFSNILNNKDLQALGTNMVSNVVSGLKDIENAFDSGSITVDEYVDSMVSANESLLKLHTSMNDLSKNENGDWVNKTTKEVDEIANSIESATKELNKFQGYLEVVNKHAEYLSENLSAGEISFDVSDESSSKFQALFDDIRSQLEYMRTEAPNAYQEIAQAIADINGTTLDNVLDLNGKIKDEFANDSAELNAIMMANNASMVNAVSTAKQAIASVINGLGNMIKKFNFSIDIKMQGIGKAKIWDALWKGSSVSSKITFSGAGFVPTDRINDDIRSGILEAGTADFGNQFANQLDPILNEILGNSKDFKMEDFLPKSKVGAGTAPRKTKGSGKGKGGGRGGDKKEIETVNAYEQAIKRLDLAISKLQNTREKMIEGSDEYNRSLQKELDLTKQKEILTQKELESVNKQLKKYAGLKEPKKNANSKTIERYNKSLKEKTTLENKSIDLQKTLNDLASKQEDILRKQADTIAESSNKRISELDQEIAILEARQALISSDSKDYFDFQVQKVEHLIQKQKQYQQDIIKTKSLLASADARGYSGSQKEKWRSDLREAERNWYESEKAIREAEKEQRVENIKNRINQVSAVSEVISNIIGDFRDKLSLIAEDDFVNKISVVTNAIGYAQQNVGSLVSAYRDLASIQPQTREEAEQLASEMTNLAKQIFESNKATLEYKRQLDNLVVEQLSNKFKSDMDKLNGLMALFQHNVNLLEDGLVDGTDISFDIGILPDIPQSNYDKERAEIEAIFEEKQRYEQEIQALKRQSFEEQSRLRDEYNEETLNAEKEFNSETQKEMINNYDEIVRLLAKGLGIEVETLDGGHKTMLEIVKASLFETKDIYNMTWQEIVATVSQALNTIAQANKKAGEYAYANFDANNKFLGLTYGKNGRSNHFSNSAYVVSESGKVFGTKGGRKSNVPDYIKRIPKYADGTEDGHKGGLALISEFDREEMVIFPDGSTKVFRNATLIDLPKGSHVLSPEETRDIKRYVGNDFDEGRVPKYARGTRSSVRPDRAGRGSSTFIRKDRNGRVLYKEKDGVVIEDNRDERGNYREKQYPTDPELQRVLDMYGGDPRVKVYRNSGGQIVVEDKTFSHTYDSLYGSRKNFNHLPSGVVVVDAQGVATTVNTGYEYTDAKGRTITVGNAQYESMIRHGADASRFRQTNRNLTYYDRENTIRSGEIRNQELARRWGVDHEDAEKGLENYKKFLEIQDKGFKELRKWQAITGQIDTIGGRPNFGYSYGNEGYYNRNGQTGHTKELDKIKFDTLFPKEIVQEFEEYKKQREIVQKSIKTEQDIIKRHFEQGGLRKDIENQIEKLIEKIDEQTMKDVQMQFKMTESILKKQQELSEEYMKKTEKSYLDGIKSGLSTDALKKLRDEYAEARQEHQQYEQALKNNIKSRFDYEFAMIDKRQNKYREFQNDTGFKIDILNSATNGKDFAQQYRYNEQLVSSYREQLKGLTDEYHKLEKAQNNYSVGSFEWNLYEQQLKKVKQELQGVNKSLVDTIAKNKELAKSKLEESFKNLNKDVEKILFDGKSQKDVERELQKQRDKYAEYVSGIEKEHALELLIRDLRKEKITTFDKEIEMMKQAEKISRDDLETLRKKVEIKKLETALEKIKGEKNIQNLEKDKDGNWDWKWVEDEKLVKDLEDKLTQSKIDLIRWTKELDFKTQDLTIKEKLDFIDRLQEIQNKTLNDEYKNSQEFVDDLNKLGITMKDYKEWASKIQDKLTGENGVQNSVFELMNKSFDNYTQVIKDLNSKLEALLLALNVDKTINLNPPSFQGGNVFKPVVQPVLKNVVDSNGIPSTISEITGSTALARENSKKFMEMIKTIAVDREIANIVSPKHQVHNGQENNSVFNYRFDNLVLPNVTDYKSLIDALANLEVYTKP